MADNSIFKLFGFEIRRAGRRTGDQKQLPSIVPPTDDDGAGYVTASGAHFGQVLNMDDDTAKDNHSLVQKYRGVSMHPEVDMAIEEITNESISISETERCVTLNLDEVDTTASIKKQIQEEFEGVYDMLNFGEQAHDIFRRWYIDGRLYHHLVVNESNLKAGIQEIRPIDAAKIRKVKQIKKKKDPITNATIVENVEEFFIYQDKPGQANSGVKMSLDSVSYVTSGLLDESRKKVVSYLHKALKPINQLRMLEDSLVIYRLSRAPERRIFYIDVGNLPKMKAEQYLRDMMVKHKNRLVYDAASGEIRDDRKFMTMLEDFWLPRREGGRGTEITSLPGGSNLGEMDDIIYFQKKLYKSLNVPISRLEPETGFTLGRASEISRDELKFSKFVSRLRLRFSHLFDKILEKQLVLKGVMSTDEWMDIKELVRYDFIEDNHFSELKDAEVLRERLQTLNEVENYTGKYFSKACIQRHVLKMDEREIKAIESEIAAEEQSGELDVGSRDENEQ